MRVERISENPEKEKIVILLATYNGKGTYLTEQLESIRTQTYRNFVCYIHDDGSLDGTAEQVRQYCREYPQQFIFLGSSRTGGAKQNFMYLLRCVDAEHIMFCDQDDVWFPEKIEKTYHAMLQEEKERGEDIPVLVYTDLMVTDENLNVLGKSFYKYNSLDRSGDKIENLLISNVAAGCTVMINRPLRQLALAGIREETEKTCFKERGSDENRDVVSLMSMHDWFLVLLASACGRLVFVEEPLLYYRQHADNTVGVQNKENLISRISYMLRKIQYYLENKQKPLDNLRDNAIAVLYTLEDDAKSLKFNGGFDQIARREEAVSILKRFIHIHSGGLLGRWLRFLRWKYLY